MADPSAALIIVERPPGVETSSFRAAVDIENRTQILAALTEDHHEAAAAFLEKRPPAFQNR